MKPLQNNWHILALITLTLFGFCLRLYNLTWQCLMVDETVTQDIAARSTIDIIFWALTIDCNPPTYYLLSHWSSMALGGVSWFSIRIPAVIFGTLAIPLSYFVGKQVQGKTLGLLVASMVSFMFPFVFYAQNARAYSMVLCAFLGFTLFWLKLMEEDRRTITIIGCSIFAAACMYSHYFSIVPLVVAMTILFLKDRAPAIKTTLLAAILFSPLAILSNPLNLISRAAPEAIPGYAMLTPDHQWWITPAQMAMYLPNELLCWSWLILLPLAGYAAYRYREGPARSFIAISVISCSALVCLASITNLSPRYAILTSPLPILAAMYPIAELIDNQKTVGRKTALFALIIFTIAVLNFGSLQSWFTFNICPLI